LKQLYLTYAEQRRLHGIGQLRHAARFNQKKCRMSSSRGGARGWQVPSAGHRGPSRFVLPSEDSVAPACASARAVEGTRSFGERVVAETWEGKVPHARGSESSVREQVARRFLMAQYGGKSAFG